MFSLDDIKRCTSSKEEIYKKLNGKTVTVMFLEGEGVSMLGLRDSEGIIYITDIVRGGEII